MKTILQEKKKPILKKFIWQDRRGNCIWPMIFATNFYNPIFNMFKNKMLYTQYKVRRSLNWLVDRYVDGQCRVALLLKFCIFIYPKFHKW